MKKSESTDQNKNNKEISGKAALGAPRFYQPFLLLQFAASAALLSLAYNYLPLEILAGIGAALSFLIVLCSILLITRKSLFARKTGRILSILLSITMIAGVIMVERGNVALVNMTGNTNQTVSVSLVVMNDSPIQSLADVKSSLIGFNASYDQEIAEATIDLIKDQTGEMPYTDPYSQYKYLADGLYHNEVDVILFNEACRPFFEDSHKNFESETRVVETFSLESSDKVAGSAVSDVTKDSFIVYLSGIDVRGEVTAKSRTDANMLVVVNPRTYQILLLGIPRDYYVTFPSLGSKDKLTHSGLYGINESIATLESLMDIRINYYARVNFSATVDIIDAMGGVDVYSPVAFTTLDSKYEVKEGTNHMSGDMALYFMRSRKMLSGGDNDRVSNQIRVIRALATEIMSFKSVTNFNAILSAAETTVQTNMASAEVQKLIKNQLKNKISWDIQNYQLKGSDLYTTEANRQKGTRTYVMEPDPDSVQEAIGLIDKMMKGERIQLDKMK